MIKSKDGSPTITVKELEEYLNLLPPDMIVTAGIAKEGIDLFDSNQYILLIYSSYRSYYLNSIHNINPTNIAINYPNHSNHIYSSYINFSRYTLFHRNFNII